MRFFVCFDFVVFFFFVFIANSFFGMIHRGGMSCNLEIKKNFGSTKWITRVFFLLRNVERKQIVCLVLTLIRIRFRVVQTLTARDSPVADDRFLSPNNSRFSHAVIKKKKKIEKERKTKGGISARSDAATAVRNDISFLFFFVFFCRTIKRRKKTRKHRRGGRVVGEFECVWERVRNRGRGDRRNNMRTDGARKEKKKERRRRRRRRWEK